MSSQPLNSNPEILLKKRKNADRLRIEKQEAARKKAEEQQLKKNQKKQKFNRLESLISKRRASERENYRIKRVVKNEQDKLKIQEAVKISKIENDEKPRLLFIVRIPGPHGAKIPSKTKKILSLLRLNHNYSAIFVKLTPTIKPLLRLCSPYIVTGKPSLSTIRNLIQKRAKVLIENTENDNTTKKEVSLNDNNLIEEKFGDLGLVCVEDLIHEIVTMGQNFKTIISFLKPFQLTPPVQGWGPLSKLKRMQLREAKAQQQVSLAGNAALPEVDIDTFIAEQI
ncbi:hypothetical protein PACTADRAFT_51004 [Pachysolen tannophilus NRRL Y-2460]|uniref:Large ribosomal subunit protein uL30-like ferredoxin-like fold domain-containing protein n=1 Tax=Pachysolen tannophilus NRRL Y-2460 TaxID=669874 RepID=A0A1E4TQV4_PACTA|nr:hypothetical protein PACTADRAFT_51004 [Pachysolen tannophilus NRRL Y-2460]